MEVTVPDVKNLAAECGLVVEETGAELHVKIPAEFYNYTRNNSECDTIMVCEINGNHIIQFWYYFELLKTKLASGVFGYCWVHRSGVGNEYYLLKDKLPILKEQFLKCKQKVRELQIKYKKDQLKKDFKLTK